jgi:hypothetical protein
MERIAGWVALGLIIAAIGWFAVGQMERAANAPPALTAAPTLARLSCFAEETEEARSAF